MLRRSHHTWWISVMVAVVLGAPGCSADGPPPATPFVLSGVANVTRVAQVTGPGSPNATDRFGIAGTDLGSMFEADGRVWFVFGDTFGRRDPGQTGGGGTEWRSNALAYSTDADPADGIRLDGFITGDDGRAAELLPSAKVDHSEMTVIPTYGFAANGAMYLAFMSVRHWGAPGEWETNSSGLARSTDGGRTWTKLDRPRWGGDSNFVQVSVARSGDDLYFWGVTHGRFGGVHLMKVPADRVEDAGAYRYFTGTDSGSPVWSADESRATVVVRDTAGELSVVWNEHLSRWLMTYSNGAGGGVTLREGITQWGPWGDAITLRSQQDVPGLYAPYQLPRYVGNGGSTIYFTLSIWDPYNVFWFKADLIGLG